MDCPICQYKTRRAFAVCDYWVRECPRCPHRFAELEPDEGHTSSVYDDRYFFGGGPGYDDYLREESLLIEHGRRYAKLLSKYVSPGTVLDVGAAAGCVTDGLARAGWKATGLEPNRTMVDAAKRRYGHPMHCSALEEFWCDEQFDLLTMFQVVAHFRNLRTALVRAARLTRPGGFWLIETWDYRSVTARVLGRHWHEYSPPSVLNWFTSSGLTQIASQCGMRLIDSGRPKKRIMGSHARSLLHHCTGRVRGGMLFQPLLHVIPKEIVLPYPAEDLRWCIFQKVHEPRVSVDAPKQPRSIRVQNSAAARASQSKRTT